ncbi:MAG: flavodoxin-dependent (E)-4-hydroxy-3-methylbut-2-enyl-diphosphate synthase [Clostridia bacterium]
MQRERRASRRVHVGSIPVGGGSPIVVQSMTNTDTRDVEATLEQISRLHEAGAEIVRVAVPDRAAAATFGDICSASPVPIVADIHFDEELALLSMRAGAAKVRLNPGNLSEVGTNAVVAEAAKRGIPIRVGANSGSLPRHISQRMGHGPEALAEAALGQIRILEDAGFRDIVVSVKASNVLSTVRANEILAERTEYPLHLGITEAGTPRRGVIHSSVGIGYLLGRGIGDTIRVSLTADPVIEVETAREILRAWELMPPGIRMISCPTCGRCRVDLLKVAQEVEDALSELKGNLTVAVMGCEVNGPGEARAADVGLCCGRGGGVLVRHGVIVRRVDEDDMVRELLDLVRDTLDEGR